jgi:hypothetical protein
VPFYSQVKLPAVKVSPIVGVLGKSIAVIVLLYHIFFILNYSFYYDIVIVPVPAVNVVTLFCPTTVVVAVNPAPTVMKFADG